ncbi:cysteine desulfurase IscS [Peptoclostridium acidaminophilum DSM 3953]|uniref:Cysteine desulfurase IscS n=1 Tax=Peptoclostridium acidaminophilum DSM 3953 TaxID=1286171 RepID=W8T462_PEPAC|nr:cysteine desulfurase NifS [Peptoclostridium acidaminophilum]AHM56544.1 cysteine desulfurase IscS [Peptoclostridium acidaminophilum DSM 3953]
MEKKRIYMDYAATTPIKKEVVDAMMPYLTEHFGNPSSVHGFGRDVKKVIDESRDKIAKAVNAKPEEIFFTGGGSESDNMAIKGIAFAYKDKGNHIITSKIEHHAVLHTCEYLEKNHGFEVTYLDVDKDGIISLEELRAAIKDNTVLITIMQANNEIGTVQPVKEIAQIASEKGVFFHTDAVQALGNIEIDVKDLGVDLMSFTAHKIYGPKGIGALYMRKGIKLHPLIHGGSQERKKRAGTENVAGIVAFAKAVELATKDVAGHAKEQSQLRDHLIDSVLSRIPYARLNGHRQKRLPGNANFCFEFIEGEAILLSLDLLGVAASSGSACTSGSLDPSHVLMALGLPHEIAHGSLRLTIGDMTTKEDIDFVVDNLEKIVVRLRELSPLYDKFVREESQHV